MLAGGGRSSWRRISGSSRRCAPCLTRRSAQRSYSRAAHRSPRPIMPSAGFRRISMLPTISAPSHPTYVSGAGEEALPSSLKPGATLEQGHPLTPAESGPWRARGGQRGPRPGGLFCRSQRRRRTRRLLRIVARPTMDSSGLKSLSSSERVRPSDPHEKRQVACDAEPHLPDIVFPTANPSVMLAERTFWEKATAIHVFCRQHTPPG